MKLFHLLQAGKRAAKKFRLVKSYGTWRVEAYKGSFYATFVLENNNSWVGDRHLKIAQEHTLLFTSGKLRPRNEYVVSVKRYTRKSFFHFLKNLVCAIEELFANARRITSDLMISLFFLSIDISPWFRAFPSSCMHKCHWICVKRCLSKAFSVIFTYIISPFYTALYAKDFHLSPGKRQRWKSGKKENS